MKINMDARSMTVAGLSHLTGSSRTIHKRRLQRLEARQMIRMDMAEKASQRRLMSRLLPEVVDADLWEFFDKCLAQLATMGVEKVC